MSSIPELQFRPIISSDRDDILKIFNYYIRHSYAAYPSSEVPPQFFDRMMAACSGYPTIAVIDSDESVAGFGMLHPHNPMATFSRTAEITYFLTPQRTGQGIGSHLIKELLTQGKTMGLATVLASISSLNEGSIRFHAHHGFLECGRFQSVGEKNGMLFDTIWMQKMI